VDENWVRVSQYFAPNLLHDPANPSAELGAYSYGASVFGHYQEQTPQWDDVQGQKFLKSSMYDIKSIFFKALTSLKSPINAETQQ